jgi:UDP-glucose 4-epimerase
VRVLVTGAGGFLGRPLVLALLRRGHQVRALDVPWAAAREEPPQGVEPFPADLCVSPDLPAACQAVDAVVHLAGKLEGEDEAIVRIALEGTRRLVDAMAEAGVRHLVLASSLSVYDWTAGTGILDEASPIESNPEARDAYTTAKLGQERLAWKRCAEAGIALTVLRPGLLWGAGREYPATIGPRVGALHLLIGARRQLPLVHVENCADAFAAAVEAGGTAEGTFNLIDHPEVTVRQYVSDHLRRSGCFGLAIPVAYRLSLAAAGILYRLAPASARRRLPSFVAPPRFAARYRPVVIDGARFRRMLEWRPPLDYQRCLDRTYGGPSAG